MSVRLQEHDRLICNAKLLQNCIDCARTVEHAVCDGKHQNPGNKIGQRRHRLDKFLVRSAIDLIEKDCKDHRKPGEEQIQSAHGKSIAKDTQNLLRLHRIFYHGDEPLEPDELMDIQRKRRAIVKECVNPAIQRVIGKDRNQRQERTDI